VEAVRRRIDYDSAGAMDLDSRMTWAVATAVIAFVDKNNATRSQHPMLVLMYYAQPMDTRAANRRTERQVRSCLVFEFPS
jgi:hypothetical protein